MDLPCVATSKEGFVCLVVQLITHGYLFYVGGDTRNDRSLSAEQIDRNIARKFDANLSRGRRAVRRQKGRCNCRYLRYGKDWYLFSTNGHGPFFDEHESKEEGQPHEYLDIRKVPIRFHGYQISLAIGGFEKKTAEEKAAHRRKKEHQRAARERGEDYEYLPRGKRHTRPRGRVCIQRERFEEIRAEALGLAVHRSADYLRSWFFHRPFLPYSPIRWQLKTILREVNRARKHHFGRSYEPVPDDAIRFYMKYVPAFRPAEEMTNGKGGKGEAAYVPGLPSADAFAGQEPPSIHLPNVQGELDSELPRQALGDAGDQGNEAA